MIQSKTIRVSKLDAARRQLDGAIQLWFSEGDPVAIHTLVCAAHQIIQDINEKNGERSFHLVDLVKSRLPPERVELAMNMVRKPMTFFKHANRDPHGILEFNPELSEPFILISITGLRLLGERPSDLQSVYSIWSRIHEPAQYKDALIDSVDVEAVEQLRAVNKKEFLKRGLLSIAQTRVGR